MFLFLLWQNKPQRGIAIIVVVVVSVSVTAVVVVGLRRLHMQASAKNLYNFQLMRPRVFHVQRM